MPSRFHFVPADFSETCHECGEAIPQDALMMPIVIREPIGHPIGRHSYTRAVLCEPCGNLMIEAQYHTIDKERKSAS